MSTLQPATEKDWQADSDAETLMQAEAVRKSPKRLKAARKVIKAKMEAYKAAVKST